MGAKDTHFVSSLTPIRISPHAMVNLYTDFEAVDKNQYENQGNTKNVAPVPTDDVNFTICNSNQNMIMDGYLAPHKTLSTPQNKNDGYDFYANHCSAIKEPAFDIDTLFK